MKPYINQHVLTEYAEAFAQKTCDSFFASKESISGKEILSFTDIPQVNYFILFRLFTSWQQEAAQLQSPYFDYSQPDVQAALEQLMNTLSQHISVQRKDFQPLVHYATESTLRLLITPQQQLTQMLKAIDFQPLTAQRLKEHSRYLRINKAVWEKLITRMEQDGKTTVDFSEAVTRLEDILEPSEETKSLLEEVETHLPLFLVKVPLRLSDLQTSSTPELNSEKPMVTEPAVATPVAPVQEITSADVKIDIEQFAKAANKPLVTVLSIKKEETMLNSLNEKINREQTTLNDTLKKEENSLLNKAQNQRITSLKDALNLNQKYYFINALFDGNNVAFAQAMHELDHCPDIATATQLLNTKYSTSLGWDTESEEYQAFVDVLERKFTT